MIDEVRLLWRFGGGLRRFLETRYTPAQALAIVEQSVRDRENSFLSLVEKAVYGFPGSPYLALLRWAGIEYGDLEKLVQADGIETAMARLYDAGVHVSLEQLKGRQPIRRAGLEIPADDSDFDNPLFEADFHVQSSGSTGKRRRMKLDFDLMAFDAAFTAVVHNASGMHGRPRATWRGILPDSAGLKQVLFAVKAGSPIEHWFSPDPISWTSGNFLFTLLNSYAVYGGRFLGAPIPVPEYTPLNDPVPIVRWLGEKVRQGTPGLISVSANNAVRLSEAARSAGVDISGTCFRVGGEPLTRAKLKLIEQAGASTLSGWAMAELGPFGGGCANREAIDDMHLFAGKVAAIQRSKVLADGESRVDAIYLTTLLRSTPKIMLNVDTGDFGVMNQRSCGCALEKAGFTTHVHTIRNYEKLTAGGVQFLGEDIIELVEEVLPARFGGSSTNYQFVEEQDGAVTQVSIYVSPRLGEVRETDIVRAVLTHLAGANGGGRGMARFWDQGRTLRVVRRDPFVTASLKTPPLKVLAK
jgi:hypothetical protein